MEWQVEPDGSFRAPWKREGASRAWIELEAAGEVFVNGRSAGRTSSTLELTPHLEDDNVLLVRGARPVEVFETGPTALIRGSEEIRTHGGRIRAGILMNGPKKELHVTVTRNGETLAEASTRESTVEIAVPRMMPWDVDSPNVYEAVFTIEGDRVRRRFGARKVEARLSQLLFNGRPLLIRGAAYEGSVTDLKYRGYNLVRFATPCDPALDECDEHGMLAWVEYPAASLKDYEGWFRRDRHHPSLLLRSFPPGEDKAVYDLAHVMIPHAVVSTPSVGDFWDERPAWRFFAARLKTRPARPVVVSDAWPHHVEKIRRELPGAGTLSAGRGRSLGETALLLDTENRSFHPDSTVEVWVSHAGATTLNGKFSWNFAGQTGETTCIVAPGETRSIAKLRCPDVTRPTRVTLSTKFDQLSHVWNLWIVPRVPVLPPVTRSMNEQASEYVNSGGSLIMVAGPVKGSWKCPEHATPGTLWQAKPHPMIEDLFQFDLWSGRVLQRAEGVETLVEVDKNPVIVETRIGQGRLLVSAFRHESPAGRWLLSEFAERRSFVSKFRDLQPADSIVPESWEMSLDGTTWIPVRADTPSVNQGRNVFDGWAVFRTIVEIPESWQSRRVILHAEAVGDAYEVAWDGGAIGASVGRDTPRDFDLTATPGRHELRFRVRDARGAGGMVGPVYLTTTPNSMVL